MSSSARTRDPGSHVGSLRSGAGDPRAGVLGLRGHLMRDKTWCNHQLPHAPSNRHSRADIYLVAAWHSDSAMRTCINIMITLTQDRLVQRVRGSPQVIRSTKDLGGQRQDGTPFSRARRLIRKGGSRTHRPLQYDGIGQRLSEGTVLMPVRYSR
jgi:hypothetical protein